MLSYETISDALLDSAEQVGLNVWQSDEAIDPHSLDRTFSMTCLPPGQASPRPSSIQASVGFRWDAAMTAISTIGTEALCERYHGDNVACSHALVGCAYESSLAVDVSYAIPINHSIGDDMSMLPRLVRAVQDAHRSMIDHNNVVSVDANVQFAAGETRVTQLKARQIWSVGDPLHELDSLEDVFEDLCSEVRDLLVALTEYFAAARLPEADEPFMPLPIDFEDERIYLRPPTA